MGTQVASIAEEGVADDGPISINHTPQDSESSSSLLAGSSGRHTAAGVKEESSDESTIISSQTSTLTRHHGKSKNKLANASAC